jgi:hypothetical protein
MPRHETDRIVEFSQQLTAQPRSDRSVTTASGVALGN